MASFDGLYGLSSYSLLRASMLVMGILVMFSAVVNSSPEFAMDFAGELEMKEKELLSV